jgi:hypothetical protein
LPEQHVNQSRQNQGKFTSLAFAAAAGAAAAGAEATKMFVARLNGLATFGISVAPQRGVFTGASPRPESSGA